MSTGFTPPPYPYELLGPLREACERHDGGMVDCSIGTPCDAPPDDAVRALSQSGTERGYPTSAGSDAYRSAASAMLARRFRVDVPSAAIAACVGTKEFVASTARYLSIRDPDRDTILFPAISYPTYAMSAQLAGLRAVPVADRDGSMALGDLDAGTLDRALLLWVNSPSNPTGRLDDLAAAAEVGRQHGIVVCSDECYAEFTWDGPARTILEHGDAGVLAVHSLSKRSNLAGVRAGFYAGDPELVAYLRLVRQHAGLIVAGPVQAAAVAAWTDDAHVDAQRDRYAARLATLRSALVDAGYEVPEPEGSFYLWVSLRGEDDGWRTAMRLAESAGILASPGALYGDTQTDHVRIAVVQPDDRIELACRRLATS